MGGLYPVAADAWRQITSIDVGWLNTRKYN